MNRFENWNPQTIQGATPVSAVSNLDIEQGILGALLLGDPAMPAAIWASRLVPEDFSAELHESIFAVIRTFVERGQVPTPFLLKSHFEGMNVENISVAVYLARLAAGAVSPTVLSSYVKSLKEMRARRSLRMIGEYVNHMASNPAANLAECAGHIVGELDTVKSMLTERRPSMSSMSVATEGVMASIGKPKDSIRTGLASLDEVLGGWHRREFTVVAARPSMGKSAFLFSALLQAAKKGTSSAIFSLEMPTDAAATRMVSDMVWNMQTPIPYVNIMRGAITQFEMQRIEAASKKYADLPIVIDDQAGLTVAEIHARARRLISDLDRQGKRLDVIAIDHLGKIRASDRYSGNKVHETGEKSNALAEMAKDLDVAVIAAHQLNRAVEGRENKRPGLSDLRDSGDIEQDAETVMFLYRPAYYLERTRENGAIKDDERKLQLSECQNTLEVTIAKNRNGPCTTLDFFCDMPSNVVRDMSRIS